MSDQLGGYCGFPRHRDTCFWIQGAICRYRADEHSIGSLDHIVRANSLQPASR